MNARRHLRGSFVVVTIAALGMSLAAWQAVARSDSPRIEYVPADSNPPVPAGLKVTCLQDPSRLTLSKTCPVVKYQGITTWAYSYLDNRLSMALVSYDGKNKVIRNVEKRGDRYVVVATSSIHNRTVRFVGQYKHGVTARWAELGRN